MATPKLRYTLLQGQPLASVTDIIEWIRVNVGPIGEVTFKDIHGDLLDNPSAKDYINTLVEMVEALQKGKQDNLPDYIEGLYLKVVGGKLVWASAGGSGGGYEPDNTTIGLNKESKLEIINLLQQITALNWFAPISLIPVKTSQLTNDSDFAYTKDIPTDYAKQLQASGQTLTWHDPDGTRHSWTPSVEGGITGIKVNGEFVDVKESVAEIVDIAKKKDLDLYQKLLVLGEGLEFDSETGKLELKALTYDYKTPRQVGDQWVPDIPADDLLDIYTNGSKRNSKIQITYSDFTQTNTDNRCLVVNVWRTYTTYQEYQAYRYGLVIFFEGHRVVYTTYAYAGQTSPVEVTIA